MEPVEPAFVWGTLVASVFIVWIPLWRRRFRRLTRFFLPMVFGPLLFLIVGSMIEGPLDKFAGVAYVFGIIFAFLFVLLFEFAALLFDRLTSKRRRAKKPLKTPPI
jgi:xanthine/uracil permease